MEKPLGLYKVCVVSFFYAKATNEEEAKAIAKDQLTGVSSVNSAELVTNHDQASDYGLDEMPMGHWEHEPPFATGRELIDHYNEQMKKHAQG